MMQFDSFVLFCLKQIMGSSLWVIPKKVRLETATSRREVPLWHRRG